MGKTKPESSKLKQQDLSKSPVKNAGVMKPSQTPKAKSKELAKQVATKVGHQTNGKKVKAPPVAESSDEEDSEDDEDDSADGSDSDEEDSDESVTEPSVKAKGVKAAPKADAETSDSSASSEEESDESEESEDDSEDEVDEKAGKIGTKPTTNGSAHKPVAAGKAGKDDESDESDESSEDDSEEEEKAKPAGLTNGAAKAAAEAESEDDSEDSSEEDSDDSDDSSTMEIETPAPKKRKAEDALNAGNKKSKSDAPAGNTSKNLFVGNLSWNVDEEWLTREFEEFGELTGVRLITDRDSGRSKGFGYVEFADIDDAVKALEAKKGSLIDGREANVDYSIPRPANDSGERANNRAQSYGDTVSAKSDTLFVGNLSFEATQDMVYEEFGNFASVQSVRLPTDRESGDPKGFGYVQFYSVEDAEKAMEGGKGLTICGRSVRLDFSTPRPPNTDSPRGRGGRGGGGRGRGDSAPWTRGGFGDSRGRGGGGRGRGGFGDRGGGRGGRGGGRGTSTNRGGFGDFKGQKKTFD